MRGGLLASSCIGAMLLLVAVGPTGLLSQSPAPLKFPPQEFSGLSSVHTPHAPIAIDGDANFTAANGVVAGSGTAINPYVIQGWDVNASAATGIWIKYTNAHFVIRQVSVHSGGRNYTGIALQWVYVNYLNHTGRPTIENCTIENVREGIVTVDVSNLTIQYNDLSSAQLGGIDLNGAWDVQVVHNRVTDTPLGASPVLVTTAANVTIAFNQLGPSGGGGVDFGYTSGARVYRNNLYRIVYDEGWNAGGNSNIRWDDGYPNGGNYWSKYTGLDRCSGMNQSDCRFPDGIGDTAYSGIGGYGGQDRYPFVGAFPDPLVPAISHTPVATAKAGAPIAIAAEIASSAGLRMVAAWYLGIGDGTVAEENLTGHGSSYSAELPPQAHAGALRYFLIAVDQNGTVVRSPQFGAYSVEVTGDIASLSDLLVFVLVGGVVIVAVVAIVLLRRKRRGPGESSGRSENP